MTTSGIKMTKALKLVLILLDLKCFYYLRNDLNVQSVSAEYINIESIFEKYDDEKNSVIAVKEKEQTNFYEDFYDELEGWTPVSSSMNIIFFGPASSFMRLDVETILHLLTNTKKHLIPISKVLLAWDLVTNGKTAAFLQGRELYAFGFLLNVVPEEDLYYINMGDPSVLAFFSKYSFNLQTRKYGVLVAAYKRYTGLTWHTNGSYIDDLGYLLCGFPASDLKLITPEVFKEINVETFSRLNRCNLEQIQTLYDIAVHREAYGRPYKWSSHEVAKVGNLLTYMPPQDISSLQLEAITSITPEVMRQMPQINLEYFTLQQILRMELKTRRVFILRRTLKDCFDMEILSGANILADPTLLLLFALLILLDALNTCILC